jgi:cytoskeletal protein CcmA (bactofilin family)
VDGAIEGNVTARDKIQLNAKGVVRGDIRAGKMVMSEGASFYGQCAIGPEAIKDGSTARPGQAAPHAAHTAPGQGQRPPLRTGEAVG